jgi:hypothetical protein
MYTPCLTYSSITDKLIAATQTVGLLADLVIPGASVVTFALSIFEEIIGRTDIMMATSGPIPWEREVMSHEYGHYTFCGLMHEQNPSAVDHIVWSLIGSGENRSKGYTYVNEAFADFMTGQVVGGANYGWLPAAATSGSFCKGTGGRCFDENFNVFETDPMKNASIARISSMMFDAFDGAANTKGLNVPDNADSWSLNSAGALTYEPVSYGSQDSNLETVSLPGKALRDYAHSVADGLGDFATGAQIDNAKINKALNFAMVQNGVTSWCDRCRVLGLHSPARVSDDSIGASFGACVTDPDVKNALGGTPPEANGRINAATCTACPAGQYSDENGACQVCTGVLVGNTCQTCNVDMVLSGTTMDTSGNWTGYPTTTSASGDLCPNLFVIEIDDANALSSRGAATLSVSTAGLAFNSGASKTDCEQTFELDLAHMSGSALVIDNAIVQTGVWSDNGSFAFCSNYPEQTWATATIAAGSKLYVAAPASPTQNLWVTAYTQVIPK